MDNPCDDLEGDDSRSDFDPYEDRGAECPECGCDLESEYHDWDCSYEEDEY